MPAVTSIKRAASSKIPYDRKDSRVIPIVESGSKPKSVKREREVAEEEDDSIFINNNGAYPTDPLSRSRFRLPGSGKPISSHQWKVYDFILSCPPGKITTYGLIKDALNSSAQAVGGALKNNPWAPEVPCHRVITTQKFIGGYMGDWGDCKEEKERNGARGGSRKIERKLKLLEEEGVRFDEKGYLVEKEGVFYKG